MHSKKQSGWKFPKRMEISIVLMLAFAAYLRSTMLVRSCHEYALSHIKK